MNAEHDKPAWHDGLAPSALAGPAVRTQPTGPTGPTGPIVSITPVGPLVPTSPTVATPTVQPLPSGPFAGGVAFAQLVRDALACAGRDGWHEMVMCDATFEDWPLREREVVSSLHAWAKTGRRITLLATTFDGVLRNQPRFVEWRKTWSHIVECRRCRTADPLDFPSALWSGTWVMQRLDLARSSGFSGPEPGRRVRLRELLDEKLRASTPGFPASTLGL